jgi:hypothetical protein
MDPHVSDRNGSLFPDASAHNPLRFPLPMRLVMWARTIGSHFTRVCAGEV